MNGKVDIDIAELERFIGKLIEFNRQLENNTYQINGQFQELGYSWRDFEYEKFGEEWHSTFNAINKYLDLSIGWVRHLRIQADILKSYKGRR